jgi:hemerythrin superfamily protein
MNILWKKKTEKIRQKFAVISAKDLTFKEGEEELMFKKLREKLGKTNEEILSLIIEF